ncbi:PD-(D/E)XK nuclease-like domain-containing protein [Paeniglutamicibacter terrestris]|uniref:Putative exodeoxyribonuclease 8 PDDEXK-like domain-containing protein n=1 Tax=Paeniglutamicibacter terrestris TaxID=2723403 RepID=A0ABX1G491_9MICC|nr:PD-(D/E)XK nuclease-like domain-containing protein [Paeniglutamicibacter terrestris]NKG21063.1 hypothetical protein [Paeniglutamicibacter terrestris]
MIRTGARAATPKVETPPVSISKTYTPPKAAAPAKGVIPEVVFVPREPTKPGIYPDMTNAEYHAHTDVLSSSTARKLVEDGGPAEYHYFTKHPRDRKKVFELGTVVHSLVLEGTLGDVVEIKHPAYTTAIAKAERDDALAAGKIPMKTSELDGIYEMRDAIYEDPEAREILEACEQREVSLFADHMGTALRARPDAMSVKNKLMPDVKTAADASRDGFRKSSGNFGYFAQDPWYNDIGHLITGAEFDFPFIVVESHPPYRVGVYRHTEYARDLGRRMNDHAINVWNRCRETGIWPGYTRREKIDLPPWTEATVHEIVE